MGSRRRISGSAIVVAMACASSAAYAQERSQENAVTQA
jgi:hypothetical protein